MPTDGKVLQFSKKIETYVGDFVLNPDNHVCKKNCQPTKAQVQEQREQLNFAAIAIMFRVLKTIRI